MTEMDLVFNRLRAQGKPMHYRDLLSEVVGEMRGGTLDEAETKKTIARLYTELSLDTRFTALGKGMWGLVKWSGPALKFTEEEEEQPKRKMTIKRTALLDDYEDEEEEVDEDFEEEQVAFDEDDEDDIDEEGFEEIPLDDEDLTDFEEEELIEEEEEWE